MGNDTGADHHPQKADGLAMHAMDDQFVVYEASTDTIHYLNPSAALVLEFCDGDHSLSDIAAVVQETYGLDCAPLGEVDGCLVDLRKTGLIR